MKTSMKTLVICICICITTVAYAQQPFATATVSGVIVHTIAQLGGTEDVFALCNFPGYCINSVPIVQPTTFVCPQPAGHSCIITVTVTASLFGKSDIAFLRLASAPHMVSAVKSESFNFAWVDKDNPDGVKIDGFTFVAWVGNVTANQVHPIEVDLGCVSYSSSCSESPVSYYPVSPGQVANGPRVSVVTQVMLPR